MKYWLLKSEPSAFSLQDLKNSPKGTASWDGIRNYQARNHIRDDMKAGDRVLYYHSSTKNPSIVGAATVTRESYPDHTAWDKKSPYYDKRSTPGNTVWCMVDVRFDEEFPNPLSLPDLRDIPALKNMTLLRKGMRLSVQPVSASEFEAVLKAARKKA